MTEQKQISSSVPLSSQEIPSQEHESSLSETTEVVITTDITEGNKEPVLTPPIVEEISESKQLAEEISESKQLAEEISESEQIAEKVSESEQIVEKISESEQIIEEISESKQVVEEISESKQVTEDISESEQVIYNEQQEEKGVNNKETENNSGVTDDHIEAAQLEISNILSNTTNTENDQETKSPLLTYVVDNNLDSLTSQQERMATVPLQYLEYDIVHATGWDNNYPPHQLLPKISKNSSNEGGIKYGKGWQSERNCTYPQEIILQVSCGAARIRKLQILSHHYKIATKLEIYVGSVQQRKELVGIDDKIYNGDNRDEKRTLWEQLPKIIDNDGINSEDGDLEDNDYEIVKPNGEPYILFRRLGYCALDSNERANYKARELKSVRLDTEGEYIRLVARRCYSNNLNKDNQVGIVGLTVMGEPADYLLAGESHKIPIEHDEGLSRVASPEMCIVPLIQDYVHNDQRNFTSLYSILPNSSLSVPNNNSSTTTPLPTNNQTIKNSNPVAANDFLSNGEETEKLLAAFDRAKQAAVKVEDFNLAKVLKYCTEYVKKASVEVIKYEEFKKRAVEEEDFDNADKYKHEIEAIRGEIRGIISDEGLDFDDSGEVIISDPSLQDIIGLADDAENEDQQLSNPGVLSGNEHQFQPYTTSAHIPKSRSNSNASIDRSGARAPEPIFPSMSKSRTSSDASISRYLDDRSIPSKIDDYPPKDELTEDEPTLSDLARSAFSLSIPYFGDNVIACLLSKNLILKESALADIIKRIDFDADGLNVEGIDKLTLIKATYQVMQEALADTREELSLQSLTLWRKLIRFCVHYQIPNNQTWKLVDNSYELLFSKISDTNIRVKQSATDLFILLAKTYRTPTQSVLSLVLKPAKTSSQPLKRAKPTVELIIRLVEEFGLVSIPKGKFDKDNKLSLSATMELSVSYLNNHHEDVQDAAVKLVFEAIKRMGRREVAIYLTDVQPSSLESILNLLTEWEETTGKVAGQITPPSPVTEEKTKNFEVDEKILKKPLAKRGTVSRLEQQLMEVRQMMNNTTSSVTKEEYEEYLNNATKAYHQDEMDEELALAAEEALIAAELEAEEEKLRQAEALNNSQTQKDTKAAAAANKKTPAARGSTTSSKAAPKKSKDDGKAASSKKTSTSKSSSASSKAKPESRRGSTDDKSATKVLTAEPEKITDEPDESKSDRCCIFCDVQDDRFTEDNLVTHYWNDCPVLTNCRLCNIILEISTLDDHMLNDCDKSKFVKQCPRCREVIEADEYLEHMAKQSCMAIRQDIVRCPLCKTVVKPATEQGWKSHLLDENGCTKNRRKSKTPVATSMVKEMEAAATAETREKKSTSSTKSSTKSSTTSKAPARKPTAASKDKPKKASTTKVSKAKK